MRASITHMEGCMQLLAIKVSTIQLGVTKQLD